MRYRLFLVFLVICTSLCAQDDKAGNNAVHPAEPTITFERFWDSATPQDYVITVKSSAEATYLSRNPARTEKADQETDPDYTVEFTMSSADRDRIFVAARETNYFQGDFDFKHKVADTGKKTLTYADPTRYFQTNYNFSQNKNITEITKLFEGISLVIEHGRKLEFLRRYDKLGLEDELKGMEEMAGEGYLAEIQIIAPLLQSISNDSSVLNMARRRAQHLLEIAGSH